ncbi:Twin-arginine translocation pathway signal [Algihabitans albus]|uniref:Twin-arginine translocation pathway signal n=1 Tax=Algihabitans albus TaxID=2164067 RepID=UPI000E5D1C4B|nr:Twin-arginine translocation pathway signal [Algihabitans albus]
MRVVDRRTQFSRRGFLTAGGAATAGLVALSVSSGVIASPTGAWAVSVTHLKPETMQTLIQMARDIYPHDRLADLYYAAAVSGYDDQAGEESSVKAMIEEGVADLDGLAEASHGRRYAEVGWEAERVALLRRIEQDPLFQTLRSGLVVGLYNNSEVWPKFGYEGASAEQGGYLDRGFDDIDWV